MIRANQSKVDVLHLAAEESDTSKGLATLDTTGVCVCVGISIFLLHKNLI